MYYGFQWECSSNSSWSGTTLLFKTMEINPASFHARFHMDLHGRRWNFVQDDTKGPIWTTQSWDHIWNAGKLTWMCTVCGGKEPVRFENAMHDEVIVPDPSSFLDAHDCDVENVRQVLET